MAVYSYKTGSKSIQISEYADTEISIFASSVLYEFINETNLFSFKSISIYSSETNVFSYNESSTLYTLSEDYGSLFDDVAIISDYANTPISTYANTEIGSILSPGSSIEDYGSISSTATQFESFGSIVDDNTPANGIVGNIESATKYSIIRASEIQGTVFLFQGKSNYYINSSHIGYGLLSYSNGISSEKNTESYVGTGKAFGFGSKAERVVASYNNSSVISYESIDYGSVTGGVATINDYSNISISTYADVEIGSILSPESSTEDYGLILDDPNLYTERDDYGLITGRGLRPFGLTSFHSSVIEKNTEDYVGSGKLFDFGTAKIFVLPIHYGRGILKIRGEYSNLKNTESYVGTGRAFGFGSKAERTVVSYNESSVVDYEGLDYGSITGGVATVGDYANTQIGTYADVEIGSILSPESSTEDYGLILDDPNLYTERDDYGLITGRGLRPFGLTSFHSSVIEKNTEDYVGSGSLFNFGTAKIFVLPIHYGRGVLKIRGEYSNLKNTESYVGTGRAFGFGSKAERTVVSYNESSIVDYIGTDYGSVTGGVATVGDYANTTIGTYASIPINELLSPGSSVEDYGSILDDPNLYTERDDYGLITGRGLRPFGLTSFHSSVIEKNTEDYVGSGSLFNFGNVKVFVLPKHIGRGVLKIRGEYSNLKNTESYVGTGRAFGFGSKAERTVVSYNESSIVDYIGTDYGSVTGGVATINDYSNISISTYADVEIGSILSPESSTEDYGFITDVELYGQQTEDYGLITGRGLRPFGLTRFSSAVIEKNTEDYVGSGSLFNFGNVKVFVLPKHIGRGVLKIRGEYSNLKNTESYVGSGSLFGFSSATEAFGPKPPASGLFRISGLVIEKNTEDYVGSGKLFDFGGIESSLLFAYNGSGIISIKGAYSNLKNTESYVGTGRAFGFGNKAERTTASYNESSIVDYEGLDYGSVTGGVATVGDYANTTIGTYSDVEIASILSPESSTEDYGSIIDDPNLYTERDDYGLITGRGLRPFGLTRFSSAVIEKNTEDYVGSGKLFNFGTIEISSTPNYVGSGILNIRGDYSDLKNTESYVGSGSLFGFGSKAERTTASYNESSVVDYEGLDYGSISGGIAIISDYANTPISTYSDVEIASILSPESSTEDYGSILDDPNLPAEREDYGLITGRGLRPFGLTRFSSAVIEKNTEDYIGGGSLFVFVSKSETNTYSPTSIGLFKFSGSVLDKNTESYVGTGRAFGFGSKAERTVVSYNESSIVDYEGLDYGSITGGVATVGDYANTTIGTYANTEIGSILSPESSTEDYGLIVDNELYGQETQDYGLITGRGLRPFGLTRFSGTRIEKNTESYFGSGSLFGFSSTTEVFGPKPPASGLFRISGAATQSITPTTEIGSGSLFTFVSSSTILQKANIGTGLFRFSGTRIEKNTESYFGSGSLFGFSSTTEVFGPKPPASGLFRISGAATQSITPTTEIGSGTVTVRQASQILDADDKTRLIAAFESTGITEVGKPQAIRLSGKVGLYFQFRETGSGTLTVRGRAVIRLKPIHIGGGSYFIRGSASESTTPATEIGSGSLFTFVSKSESFGANPPENTALFKFTGSSVNKNTESYVGIGLERINVESLILIRPRYPGSGSISVTSTSTDNRRYNYIGTGNLFGFGSASEYLTNAYKLDTFVIKIRGFAKETHTERFVGSGSVFTFISAAESKGSNPPENIALFKFGGSSTARTQPIYLGEGKVKISEGSGRPDQNNKTYIASSEESSSFRTIEETAQIKVFGSGFTAKPSVYKGKGSLFGFSSGTESAAFSPDDTRELFKISGSAIEKNTESFVGSGSVFSFVGTSYSSSKNTRGETNLFSINGSAKESFGEGLYTGSGRLVTDLRSTTKVSFTPKVTTTLFNFIGSSGERNTEAFRGSGSIGVFTNTAQSVFYDYKVSQRAFRIFGNTFESFARSNYDGIAFATIVGFSNDRKINYIPPKRSRVFII